jgi:hypothetical protein
MKTFLIGVVLILSSTAVGLVIVACICEFLKSLGVNVN